jgi:hypothetical protein
VECVVASRNSVKSPVEGATPDTMLMLVWEYRFGEPYQWLRCRTCMMESPSYARFKQKLREGSRDDLGIAQATTDVATVQTDARGHQLSAGAFGPPGVSASPKKGAQIDEFKPIVSPPCEVCGPKPTTYHFRDKWYCLEHSPAGTTYPIPVIGMHRESKK